jgi:hypothetical protein
MNLNDLAAAPGPSAIQTADLCGSGQSQPYPIWSGFELVSLAIIVLALGSMNILTVPTAIYCCTSYDKCTYCKSLWIKASAKCPKCKCLIRSVDKGAHCRANGSA